MGSYDEDFLGWLEQQVALLRAERFSELDFAQLLQHLEDLAENQELELQFEFHGILVGLLKIQLSSATDPRWADDITELRYRLLSRVERSPSLMNHAPELFARAWEQARDVAKKHFETLGEHVVMPKGCVCTMLQAMDVDFVPAGEQRRPLPARDVW